MSEPVIITKVRLGNALKASEWKVLTFYFYRTFYYCLFFVYSLVIASTLLERLDVPIWQIAGILALAAGADMACYRARSLFENDSIWFQSGLAEGHLFGSNESRWFARIWPRVTERHSLHSSS